MKNKNFKQLKNFAKIGGISSFLIFGLTACNDANSQNQNQGQNSNTISNANQQQGAFVIVEQDVNGNYKIADEFPASKTTIVLRNPDGSERILSQAEIDKLVKEEEKKIDAGTSALTNPEMSSGGMGLGGVLLSSIAGAMIGSWLGNKLFNNQNFNNQRAAQYKSPQTYSKSQNSFNNRNAGTKSNASSSRKSGFFGGNNSSNRSSSNSSFGG
ncbi:hypothetical protein AAX26_01680 [Aliarcobacter thereius]|uniref:UPF0323 domain-containing protein n=1 Tax=Aliarcobacter thereius TaxID=544718 RepID=A0A5R9GWR5_9BACT|nr:UPF0323 family lipoprotein [Aliarcobacter thereius]OCL86029.1 hypothetical protein AAX26_01680 [Aliarcobacter thereius]TLS71077.1 hypothetical protein FE246_08930 [Aliarcobacter thereius]TLT06681.1 hypothetical protein FE243_07205 [Aliarcobacter thereius]